MRFYDPSTNPPTRLDSRQRFPDLREREGARACLELGFLPSVTHVLKVIREESLEQWLIKEGKCYLHAFQAARTLWELQVREG